MEESAPDVATFETVYAENFDWLARYAEAHGAFADGPDVAQEAMMRLLRQGEQFDYEDSPRSWLSLTAGRLLIDRSRARRARPQEVFCDTEVFDLHDSYESTAEVHTRVMLEQALDTLTADHALAVRTVYLRGLSVKQAAEVLGVPSGTVRSRCYYGLRAARSALAAAGLDADSFAE